MRKSVYSLLAMALCLFASTSCSEEELTYEGGDKQNVTFQVEMEDTGTGSRALSDGSNVDKVYYAVYETGKDQLLTHGDETVSNGVASVIIPLVNGLKFDIVFFAHCTNSSAFIVPLDGDLRNIKMKGALKANQEAYDAFFHARKEFQTTSNTTTPVTLKRPLAQLNVATTAIDLQNAANLNATVTHSKIVLKDVPTLFDARSGIASGNANVTFETEAILKQANGTNEMCIVGTESFNYLAMAYVLVNDESGLFDSEFEFYRADEDEPTEVGDMVSKRVIPNLPLQRNYRTNVTGNILTQNENFSITLDTDFNNTSHHVEASDITVKDISELNTTLAKLAKQNTKELILNVKGLSAIANVDITIPDDATVSSITLNLLDLPALVSSLEVSGTTYAHPVFVSIPTTTTVTATTINVPNAHVTLKQGTHTTVYSTTHDETLEVAAGTEIKNLIVNKGNVVILNGGEVEKVKRGNENSNNIVVSVEPGGKLGSTEGESIKVETTLENIDGKWVLTEDVTLVGSITIPADETMTIDLNGYDLNYSVSNAGASAIINNKGTLNIINTGNNKNAQLKYVAEDPDMQEIPAYATNTITNTGTLTIGENVTVTNGSEGGASYAVDNHGIFTLNGGTLIGNRCALRVAKYNQDNVKFTMNSGLIEAATPAWIQLPGSDASVAPTITVDIKGGTMKTTKESSADNDVMYTYSFGNSHANTIINISGGEFLGGTVSIGAGYKGDAPTLNITGGEFEYDVLQWLENDAYKVVYQTPIIISTAAELAALGGTKINGTYELAADIDMTGVEMKSMEISGGATVVFNGKGYTISNLNLAAANIYGMTGEGNEVAGLFDLTAPATTVSLTVNDLKIKNAKVACSGYAAAIVGYNSNSGTVITLNNVDVNGTEVTADTVAALVGYTTGKVNLTDCDVTGLILTGEEGRPEKVGALIGTANTATCAVATTNCTNNTEYGDYGRVINGAFWNGTKFESADTQDKLNSAVTSGANVDLTLGTGEYTLPSSTNGNTKTLIIKGTKDTKIDVTNGSYWDSANLTFEGITIKTGTGKVNGNGSDYAALYSPNVTYKNVTFVGPMRVGRDGAKFINCTFTELGNDYVWTYGNDVTFEGCTFNTDGKAILIYSDGGNEVSAVSVKNCKFNATQGAKAGAIANQNCAAIEIHNYGNGVNLTTSGNTVDTTNFSGEWRIKTYETGKPKVIVNGTEYTTIALDGKTMTIDADKNVTVNE